MPSRTSILLALAIALPGCTEPGDAGLDEADAAGKTDDFATTNGLGARWRTDRSAVDFRVYSLRATRVELEIFAEPFGADAVLRFDLALVAPGVWGASVAADAIDGAIGADRPIDYGYRAWGPNGPDDSAWQPGSSAGFRVDVDGEGNRFNPNKLLTDPYAREVSHDPGHADHTDASVFASGPDFRHIDSAPFAPKAIVLGNDVVDLGPAPTRPLKDDIVYEVHVRGLTRNDPTVPAELRGTYAGAALKAGYLADLGVTAIELLPVHELQDDQNDLQTGTAGDNYWGYATLSFFAPDRRYAADRSPGGPTREFQEMVRAFHQRGIKVYMDVVYNHTGEGGLWDGTGNVAELLTFRGLDTELVLIAPHGVSILVVPLGPARREVAHLVDTDGPRFGDEVDAGAACLRPDRQRAHGAVQDVSRLELVELETVHRAPVAEHGGEVEAKPVHPHGAVPVGERVDDEVADRRICHVEVARHAIGVDVDAAATGELVVARVVEAAEGE
jgi:glycogen operon protein